MQLSNADIGDAFLIEIDDIVEFMIGIRQVLNITIPFMDWQAIAIEELETQFHSALPRDQLSLSIDDIFDAAIIPTDKRNMFKILLYEYIEYKIGRFVTKQQRMKFNFQNELESPTLMRFWGPKT